MGKATGSVYQGTRSEICQREFKSARHAKCTATEGAWNVHIQALGKQTLPPPPPDACSINSLLLFHKKIEFSETYCINPLHYCIKNLSWKKKNKELVVFRAFVLMRSVYVRITYHIVPQCICCVTARFFLTILYETRTIFLTAPTWNFQNFKIERNLKIDFLTSRKSSNSSQISPCIPNTVTSDSFSYFYQLANFRISILKIKFWSLKFKIFWNSNVNFKFSNSQM